MSTIREAPLKGHWPVAFAMGGTPEDPALVPLNYMLNVIAGDGYRVPVQIPDDVAAGEYVDSLIDARGWARIGPAVGVGPVAAILSIPDFAARPLVVFDEGAKALADASPVPRTCITLGEIRDAAREVMPDRDPTVNAPAIEGRSIDRARDLGFSVYWAIGDGMTPTRRHNAMIAAGWPESVIEWVSQPQARPAESTPA